ncbi:DnaJ (Hsp40), sub C, member 17 [Entomophthora muscae]|uniref:DnaJ (Hsp40), sub C, member 17 n=1 Tax=Entomophthora muscae TaxID=34485 RepID=A0ACC2SSC0_9FUNG|nr:DnaJ (Hsp40), sub C, member 17 [Entomophthora muscae]
MSYQPEKIEVEGRAVNYYEFLQLEAYQPDSAPKELRVSDIRKAYRAKALIYHPDKNPGDEIAAQLFLQLKRVYDVLLDPQRKSEYDRHLLSSSSKRQRVKEMDGVRKKARDDLLKREQAARDFKEQEQQNAAQYETELDRLRRRTNAAPTEPRQAPRPQPSEHPKPRHPKAPQDANSKLKARLNELEAQLKSSDTTLKIRWKRKIEDHNVGSLTRIFSDFGTIDHIIPSSKKPGTALISYTSVVGPHAVMNASVTNSEKLSAFEISWANASRQQPPLVKEILELMKELASQKLSTQSSNSSDNYEAAVKLTLAQFESWTLARAQAFDQARQGTSV